MEFMESMENLNRLKMLLNGCWQVDEGAFRFETGDSLWSSICMNSE